MAKIEIDFDKISEQYQEYASFDCSFRTINYYMAEIDSLITSISVKFSEEEQYTVSFVSSQMIVSGHPNDTRFEHNLITPKRGVEECFNVRANKKHLIKALRELAQDIENGN